MSSPLPADKIPVSVIIATRNEEQKLSACLFALSRFSEVVVVDSGSRDRTCDIARSFGARVEPFVWNGAYPKKRQWCLDTLDLAHDWVFFVDADEILTRDLVAEIADLFRTGRPACAGYFVTGKYTSAGKVLRFGVHNRKLALFDRGAFAFPVVDDLDIPGMGEIEGHYQPIPRRPDLRIGSLSSWLLHDALDDRRAWTFRHEKYARWEAGMNRKAAWPADPLPSRETVKRFMRGTRFRPEIYFLVACFLKMGFLDGRDGIDLARSKYDYYRLVAELDKRKAA